jgi:hypothetical protein
MDKSLYKPKLKIINEQVFLINGGACQNLDRLRVHIKPLYKFTPRDCRGV